MLKRARCCAGVLGSLAALRTARRCAARRCGADCEPRWRPVGCVLLSLLSPCRRRCHPSALVRWYACSRLRLLTGAGGGLVPLGLWRCGSLRCWLAAPTALALRLSALPLSPQSARCLRAARLGVAVWLRGWWLPLRLRVPPPHLSRYPTSFPLFCTMI